MGIINDRLYNILNSFDSREGSLEESAIYTEINALASEKLEGDEEEKFRLLAETMAFGFIEDYSDKKTGWDTYFGPMVVMQDKSGQWFESPSIRLVTPEMLSYWFGRAQQAKNPVLRKRYADLVWDLSRKVTGAAPDIQAAYIAIDNAFQIVAEKRSEHQTFAVHKLERGLSIALSISDSGRMKRTITAIIALEDEVGADTNIGRWGFSFDALMKSKKIPLTNDQRHKIINDLESRLQRFVNNTDYPFSVPAAENAAVRLVQYYQRQNNTSDVQRVLRLYGGLVTASAEKARAMTGLVAVEKLFDMYHSQGMREEAEGLAQLLEKLGKRTDEEMHTFSHEMTVTNKELEEYFSWFLDNTFEIALVRIAVEFIPKYDQVAKQVRELAKEMPLTFLISTSLKDGEGRTIARIGPIEEDFDGHVIHQTAQDMQFTSPFLNGLLKRVFETYHPSLETLVNYLYLSPIYQPENRTIISAGVDAYLRNDHLVAAHLIIPQIESALRYLLQQSGGAVYKPGRNGGLFLKTLDEILREEKVRAVLEEDTAQYLQILLTDQRGWNLRNDVCHGMAHSSLFGPVLTDRLFHVLLVLALIRDHPTNPEYPG